MKDNNPPFFVYEDLDMHVFSTIEEIEREFEPDDFRNISGIGYEGYDSKGNQLQFIRKGARVKVEIDMVSNRPKVLERAIRLSLKDRKEDSIASNMNLDLNDLVQYYCKFLSD